MKTNFLVVLLILIVGCLSAETLNDTVQATPGDTLSVVCIEPKIHEEVGLIKSTCQCEDCNRIVDSISNADDISTLTLAVNTVNNALTDMNNLFTVVTIIIGIVTLLVAVVGLLGFHDVRKDVNEHKKKVYEEIDIWKIEAENLKKKIKEIEKTQTLNNQYIQRINQWIYNNANAIAQANGVSTTQGRNLMKQSTLNYYFMKLFLSKDKHEIDSCINFIKTQGGKEAIEYLKFIVDNEPDEYKRIKSSEAIGYIKHGIP